MASGQQDIGIQRGIVHSHILDDDELDRVHELQSLVLIRLIRNNVSARGIERLDGEVLAKLFARGHDVIAEVGPVENGADALGNFARGARHRNAGLHVALSKVRLAGEQTRTRPTHLAGHEQEGIDAFRAVHAVVVVVQAELHVRLNIAFLRVKVREMLNVLNAHTSHFRSVLQRPRLNSFPNHLHFCAHRDALDRSHAAKRGLSGLGQRHGAGARLIPHYIRVDGNLLALSISSGLSWLHAQIAHAQEHTVFLDQQGRLGVVAQEISRLPTLLEDLANSTERQSAISSRMNRDEPVGLRGHGAISDVDNNKFSAGVTGFEEEVSELLL